MSDSLPPLALLAGGLATRLRPITDTIPKSMIPVAGKPFIAHQLALLTHNGIRDIVICCGFLGDQIQKYVGDGSSFNCSVRYSWDDLPLKGTGGAVRRALPMLGECFFVMYGDSFLPIDFRPVFDVFLQKEKPGLMTVFHNEGRWDRSNVEFVDNRIRSYDKQNATSSMHYIDYGLGILRRQAFDAWTGDEIFDLASVYRSLLAQDQLAGMEVHRRFYEIGTLSGLSETDALLRSCPSPWRDDIPSEPLA